MILNKVPACIEGANILLIGKKINKPNGFPELINGDMVFIVTIQRNGSAKIITEFDYENPLHSDSLKTTEDSIEGRHLWGFATERPKKLKKGTKRSQSGAHSNQEMTIKGKCFMALIDGWGAEPLPNIQQYYFKKGDLA